VPHTEDLEPPVRAMLDATNAADSQAFLARWNDNENIGVQNRIEITG
jgi:hypothetical protein